MNNDINILLQMFANELSKAGKMRTMTYGELFRIIEKIRNEKKVRGNNEKSDV